MRFEALNNRLAAATSNASECFTLVYLFEHTKMKEVLHNSDDDDGSERL
jgi:hypothetical protein